MLGNTNDTTTGTEREIMNHLTITGNLGKDPLLSFTKDNKAISTLSIAVSQSKREGDKWVDGATLWLQVVFFGTQAEKVSNKYFKGDTVTVSGKLVYEEYKNADGEDKTSIRVLASDIEKVDRQKAEKSVATSEKVPF